MSYLKHLRIGINLLSRQMRQKMDVGKLLCQGGQWEQWTMLLRQEMIWGLGIGVWLMSVGGVTLLIHRIMMSVSTFKRLWREELCSYKSRLVRQRTFQWLMPISCMEMLDKNNIVNWLFLILKLKWRVTQYTTLYFKIWFSLIILKKLIYPHNTMLRNTSHKAHWEILVLEWHISTRLMLVKIRLWFIITMV